MVRVEIKELIKPQEVKTMITNKAQVDRLKNQYPSGTRIELLSSMNDIQPIESGSKGTVIAVDDIGTIHMRWDNGRGLGLIPGVDHFKIISTP